MPLRTQLLSAVSAIAFLISVFFPTRVYAEDKDCVDVAIVLAVDGSGSIDTEEFFLQQQAIAKAFRDPAVLQALERAGTVAASVLYWGDPNYPIQETPFVIIDQPEHVESLINHVETLPRRVFGSTGLAMGLSASMDKLQAFGCAHRSIINVSGDGSDTIFPRNKRLVPSLRNIRARAEEAGVTINALVIKSEEKGISSYFEKQIITGPGAFVMEIENFSHYADALKRKLIREISPTALSHIQKQGDLFLPQIPLSRRVTYSAGPFGQGVH